MSDNEKTEGVPLVAGARSMWAQYAAGVVVEAVYTLVLTGAALLLALIATVMSG